MLRPASGLVLVKFFEAECEKFCSDNAKGSVLQLLFG